MSKAPCEMQTQVHWSLWRGMPELCRMCDKEEVTEIIFGPEDEEDTRFILLPDCNHIVAVEMLDRWMSTDNSDLTGESQEITLKV